VLDLSSGDLDEIISQGLDVYPEMDEATKSMVEMVISQSVRVMLLDTDPEHVRGGLTSNIIVGVDRDAVTYSFPLDLYVEVNKQGMVEFAPGVKILGTGLSENANGIPIGTIELEQQLPMGGRNIPVFQWMVIFRTEDNTILISFTASDEILSTLKPVFDEIVDSIELVEP
jgi:hypothetical protein